MNLVVRKDGTIQRAKLDLEYSCRAGPRTQDVSDNLRLRI